MKKTFLLSFLLMIAINFFAQPTAQRFDINGMKFANSMFEDSQGNLWFHCNNKFFIGKAVKYDGSNFTIPNLYNMRTFYINIVENDKGEVYFGHIAKLFKIDQNDNPICDPEVKRAGNIFIDSNNRFWVFTVRGLLGGSIGEIKNNIFVEDKSTIDYKFATTVFEDKQGVIWAGSVYGGLYKYANEKWEIVSNQRVTEIREMPDGTMWMGSIEGKIFKYKNSRFEEYNYGKNYFCATVAAPLFMIAIVPGIVVGYAVPDIESSTEIEIDKNQEVWALIHKKGVVVLQDGRFVEADKKYQIPSLEKATSLFKDKDGNLLISTKNNGIIKYDGKEFTIYDKEIGVPKKLLGVSVDSKGNIWGIGKKFVVKISE